MTDPWEGEIVPGEDDWDQGQESLETDIEDAFDDSEDPGDEPRDDEDDG